jgi:hypothetical protein
MNPRVKITPRIAAPVARRLRLAASLRSSSMSAVVNDVLDEAHRSCTHPGRLCLMVLQRLEPMR